MQQVLSPTIRYDVFVAGDVNTAKSLCAAFCFDAGLCVTVEPVTFIYTGGREEGVRVGLISYPRFPVEDAALGETTRRLADALLEGLHQHSYSIVGPRETIWVSRREQ